MLDIEYPVILAGMGGISGPVSGPELVAAVSNAGGLGVLGCVFMAPDRMDEMIRRTKSLTDRPFGVDTVLPAEVPQSGTTADFRAEVGSVLAYLDLPWDESVLSYADRAIDRGRINTNSYHQVTQPIYKRSKDRWRAYEAQLRPLMPYLQRHIENFGYGD